MPGVAIKQCCCIWKRNWIELNLFRRTGFLFHSEKIINFANALPYPTAQTVPQWIRRLAQTTKAPVRVLYPVRTQSLALQLAAIVKREKIIAKSNKYPETTNISPTWAISPPYSRILSQARIRLKEKLEKGRNNSLPNGSSSSSSSEDSASVNALSETMISIVGHLKALSNTKISIYVLTATFTINIWVKNGVFAY